MNPRQFEELVCEYYRSQGYKAETTPYSNDYGIDVFATKGKEKLAIQAKMYGNSTRKINRQMVMELHGAKDYFDCTKAIIATEMGYLQSLLTFSQDSSTVFTCFCNMYFTGGLRQVLVQNSQYVLYRRVTMKMSDQKSVRFRQEQVSVLNGNNCPLSAGFGVRNHRNLQYLHNFN